MAVAGPRTFVLDTNCFVDASRGDAEAAALAEFSAWATPGLYLRPVVAAELSPAQAAPRIAGRWNARSCRCTYVVDAGESVAGMGGIGNDARSARRGRRTRALRGPSTFRIRHRDRTVVPRAWRDARLTEFRRPVLHRQGVLVRLRRSIVVTTCCPDVHH